MRVTGFIWLQAVVEKIESKHNLNVVEVEEVFAGKPEIRFLELGKVDGENLYSA